MISKSNSFIYKGEKSIKEELSEILSDTIEEKIEKSRNALLFKKIVTHSDLISSGKRAGKDQKKEKNILTYLSYPEMENLNYELTAKQSNITLPSAFYNALNVPLLKRRKGKQKKKHDDIHLEDYCNIRLFCDSTEYFSKNYTDLVSEKLGKAKIKHDSSLEEIYTKTKAEFVDLELTYKIHGLGASSDLVFQELRKNIYRQDIMYFLVLDTNEGKEVIILLKKNPKFFNVLGITNDKYTEYLQKIEFGKNISSSILEPLTIEEEKTRKLQSVWRKNLAYELMNYTAREGVVICPISGIELNFDDLGTIMRASHIKPYKECSVEEAYDLNNGILMTANADALFDKFLFTIDQDKEFCTSFVIEEIDWFIKFHFLDKPVAKILNNDRMNYLLWHNRKFESEEEKRRGN